MLELGLSQVVLYAEKSIENGKTQEVGKLIVKDAHTWLVTV